MNILVTGAQGFVGKNLCGWIEQRRPGDTVLCCDIGQEHILAEFCREADFVFHLAGVNRPNDINEFEAGNKTLTEEVLAHCRTGKKPPVLLTSTAQAELDNPYGKSKAAAERAVFAYGDETSSAVYVYRLPGVFGKWCRPNYNNVVATFCYNIANNQPIEVRDPAFELNMVYIDDVCRSFLQALDGCPTTNGDFCTIEPVHSVTLGDLAETLTAFSQSRADLQVPDMADALTRKLHSTYLSYLPNLVYTPITRADERGSFTELLKAPNSGQVSVNVTKPGFTKGNHWHHTKTEKFITVSGQGVIRLRKIGEKDIAEYHVQGDKPEIVDIPPGYTHSLTNTGVVDLVTVMWVDEIFNPQAPDTFPEDVLPKED